MMINGGGGGGDLVYLSQTDFSNMCIKSSVDFVDCALYTIPYNKQIQQSKLNFSSTCPKPYVDFVDWGLTLTP